LRLTWIELKVFAREPLGAIGSIVMPVLVFLLMGRLGRNIIPSGNFSANNFFRVNVPVFVAILIALNAVLSLVAIISIYREGGILKRLRATPLRPWTILTAHVLVKLLLTAITLSLMLLAGRRYYPVGTQVPALQFAIALIITTWSILSIGFLIAAIVPTARFAQPIGAIVLYPMVAVSGLIIPMRLLPAWFQHLPLANAVSLLSGIWKGEPWSMHTGDVIGLVATFVICTALSARVFRWE
ncbi:MAG TPA: ABC transporter permease, partial [Gemmatimonadaceae bacterium]|nr:ABC transporter permease [Gemmatimonadaceae bacterium]